MRVVQYALSGWPGLLTAALFSSLSAGVGSVGIVIVLLSIAAVPHTHISAVTISLVVAAVLTARASSRVLLSRLTADATLRIRSSVTEAVLHAPFDKIEGLGPTRIEAALIQDTNVVASSFPRLVQLAMNVAIVCGGLSYLAWLDTFALSIVAVGIVTGFPICRTLQRRTVARANHIASLTKQLFAYFRAFADGIKELKLHAGLRHHFMQTSVAGTTEALKDAARARMKFEVANSTFAYALAMIIVGILVILHSSNADGMGARSAIVMLYMMGPLEGILGASLALREGSSALLRIDKLIDVLEEREDLSGGSLAALENPLLSVRYVGVAYRYSPTSNEQGFALGPIDLELRPGVVTFLTGGNGSGKTTFVKLATGLYRPQSGQITINGHSLLNHEWHRMRKLFGAVYHDHHFFGDLRVALTSFASRRNADILGTLDVDTKTVLNAMETGDSTLRTLSQGQRKRVALLTTVLDDRPIFVFDEWAADQDPHYKTLFYEQLVPEFRRLGKAVLIVTHDDRYFHTADEIVELDGGQVSSLYCPLRLASPEPRKTDS